MQFFRFLTLSKIPKKMNLWWKLNFELFSPVNHPSINSTKTFKKYRKNTEMYQKKSNHSLLYWISYNVRTMLITQLSHKIFFMEKLLLSSAPGFYLERIWNQRRLVTQIFDVKSGNWKHFIMVPNTSNFRMVIRKYFYLLLGVSRSFELLCTCVIHAFGERVLLKGFKIWCYGDWLASDWLSEQYY